MRRPAPSWDGRGLRDAGPAPAAALRAGWVLVVAALLLTACGDGGSEVAARSPGPSAASPTPSSPSPSPSPSAVPVGQTCTHPTEGYTVGYPADWFVADGDGIEPCSFFHPEPLELEPATEADGVAIRLDVLTEPYPEARRMVESDGEQEAQEAAVGSRRAVRFVGETDDSGLLPPGLATTTWLVELDERTLLLTTDEGGGDDYEAAVEVLDRMARSVEVA